MDGRSPDAFQGENLAGSYRLDEARGSVGPHDFMENILGDSPELRSVNVEECDDEDVLPIIDQPRSGSKIKSITE